MTDIARRDERVGQIADLVRELLADDDGEGATAYLGQGWLSRAVEDLIGARKRAGLTQEEVAERLGTTQSAIARMEKDDDGRFTFHRYLAYAQAVGMQPLDVALEPLGAVRSYALAQPDAPRNQLAYSGWYTTVKSQELEQVYTPTPA